MRLHVAGLVILSFACGRTELAGGSEGTDLGCRPGSPMRVLASGLGYWLTEIRVDTTDAIWMQENTTTLIAKTSIRGGDAVHSVVDMSDSSSWALDFDTTASTLVYHSYSQAVAIALSDGTSRVLDTLSKTPIWTTVVAPPFAFMVTGDVTSDIIRAPLDGSPADVVASVAYGQVLPLLATNRFIYAVGNAGVILRIDRNSLAVDTLAVANDYALYAAAPDGIVRVAYSSGAPNADVAFLADDATSFDTFAVVTTSEFLGTTADDTYVWIGTREGTILRVSRSGEVQEAASGFFYPAAIVTDANCIYVADAQSIIRVSKPD